MIAVMLVICVVCIVRLVDVSLCGLCLLNELCFIYCWWFVCFTLCLDCLFALV